MTSVSILVGAGIVGRSKADKQSVEKINHEISRLSDDVKALSNNRVADMKEVTSTVINHMSELKDDIYQRIDGVEKYAATQYGSLKSGLDSISASLNKLNNLLGHVQGEIKRINGV